MAVSGCSHSRGETKADPLACRERQDERKESTDRHTVSYGDSIEWFTTARHTTSGAASSVPLARISSPHVNNIAAQETADDILQRKFPQKITWCSYP